MLGIVNYGMGNVKSVYNAFTLLGEESKIIEDPRDLTNVDAIVLPGVGSFSDGMKNLKKMGFLDEIENQVLKNKKPYLGICLGLEFLARKSFEGGESNGFGWIDGDIKKIITGDSKLNVPHTGWDDTNIIKNDGVFKEIINPTYYYVHSYYLELDDPNDKIISSICNYGKTRIISSIQIDNIFAVQFHPEKSQSEGIKLLKNFIEEIVNVKK